MKGYKIMKGPVEITIKEYLIRSAIPCFAAINWGSVIWLFMEFKIRMSLKTICNGNRSRLLR